MTKRMLKPQKQWGGTIFFSIPTQSKPSICIAPLETLNRSLKINQPGTSVRAFLELRFSSGAGATSGTFASGFFGGKNHPYPP